MPTYYGEEYYGTFYYGGESLPEVGSVVRHLEEPPVLIRMMTTTNFSVTVTTVEPDVVVARQME